MFDLLDFSFFIILFFPSLESIPLSAMKGPTSLACRHFPVGDFLLSWPLDADESWHGGIALLRSNSIS